jgi:hypothetical protein
MATRDGGCRKNRVLSSQAGSAHLHLRVLYLVIESMPEKFERRQTLIAELQKQKEAAIKGSDEKLVKLGGPLLKQNPKGLLYTEARCRFFRPRLADGGSPETSLS